MWSKINDYGSSSKEWVNYATGRYLDDQNYVLHTITLSEALANHPKALFFWTPAPWYF
jgi:hypothetical protein